MVSATVRSTTKGSDGLYYTRLQKTEEDGIFGDQVLTGFVANETDPDVGEGEEIELTSKKDQKIRWQA